MREGRAADLRLEAFRDRSGPEVFRSVAYTQEVWKDDPFDVPSIHAEAREAFDRLVRRAGRDADGVGKVLLVLGPAGCGKTHLMRALRTDLHGTERGWFGYMQMTTETSSYERYLLLNCIDALDQPYDRRRSPRSGLRRLSDALVARAGDDARPTLDRLDDAQEAEAIPALAFEVTDRLLLADPALTTVDPDLLRALVLLQSSHPLTRSAVLKFLRGERLSAPDRARIGGLEDRGDAEDALRFLQGLGRVMATTAEGAFVLCVDQLEDLYEEGAVAAQRFRRAMETLARFAQQVPNAVVVVSCLRDYYDALEANLKASTRDRLVQDPAPIRLRGALTLDEVRAVVAARLRYLYEELEAPFDPSAPIDPFPDEEIARLAGVTVRTVLHRCREAQERSMGMATNAPTPTAPAPPPLPERRQVEAVAELERRWNDFRSETPVRIPDGPRARAALLARGFELASRELEHELAVTARADGEYVRFECRRGEHVLETALLALCEGSPRGGGLYREVTRVLNFAASEERVPVVARSTEFPTHPRARATQRLGEVVAEGGRRALVADEAWRDLALLPRFEARHPDDPALEAWLRWERPLTRLPALQELLDLEGRAAQLAKEARWRQQAEAEAAAWAGLGEPAGPTEGDAERRPRRGTTTPSPSDPLVLGFERDDPERAYLLKAEDVRAHVAVLGTAASDPGPTTRHLLLELLARGIPALVLDRRGTLADLAAAHPDAIASRLEIRRYAPGAPGGPDLAVPLVPPDLADVRDRDGARTAEAAAAALGALLGYRLDGAAGHARRLAILAEALRVAAATVVDRAPTLDDLVRLIDEQDPALLHALGKLESRHSNRLVEHLEMLGASAGNLVAPVCEVPDFDAWLGVRPPTETVPLTLLDLRALGAPERVHYWVARFLMELVRHARLHPADRLRGVVALPDAELYLPVGERPATKDVLTWGPLRLAAGGIGLILATAHADEIDLASGRAAGTVLVGSATAGALPHLDRALPDAPEDLRRRLAAQAHGAFTAVRGASATPLGAATATAENEVAPDADPG